jgi:hypothetical protein
MNRAAGIVFLAVGILLVGWGFYSSESLGSGISRMFSGSPTDRTIYLLVRGAPGEGVVAGSSPDFPNAADPFQGGDDLVPVSRLAVA